MNKPTPEQVRAMVEEACFYVTPEGLPLRIQFHDDETFTAMDEDSFEDYTIPYDEVTLEGREEFQKLVKMEVVETD